MTEIRDIICPVCKGAVDDKPKGNENILKHPWGSSPINLHCPACDIEWRV